MLREGVLQRGRKSGHAWGAERAGEGTGSLPELGPELSEHLKLGGAGAWEPLRCPVRVVSVALRLLMLQDLQRGAVHNPQVCILTLTFLVCLHPNSGNAHHPNTEAVLFCSWWVLMLFSDDSGARVSRSQ